MKTLYLDCGMGAAGDMLTAALLELLPDPDAFVGELNALGIPGVEFRREAAAKCGILGTHMAVSVHGEEECSQDGHEHVHAHEHGHDHEHNHDHDHDHDHEHEHEHDHDHEHGHDHEHEHHHDHVHPHHHSGMGDIERIVEGLPVSPRVRADVLAVYGLIAQAESRAHGLPVTEIHFHEVGTLDAVADVTAVCLLMERLGPEQVVVSPVHVGSGHVHCAHGVLPVPAPATADLLREVPIYGGRIDGELCTPTGAALLKHFATRFGEMPVMRTRAVGRGMGRKDFEQANCLQAFWGETAQDCGQIAELRCNVDDMTAEDVGFALERFFAAGALDAFTVPIGMKKSRPGVLICVLCGEERREELAALMLRHTTTLGVRESLSRRYVLDRSEEAVETPLGTVRRKLARGGGSTKTKYEFEDLARLARERDLSLAEVRRALDENA